MSDYQKKISELPKKTIVGENDVIAVADTANTNKVTLTDIRSAINFDNAFDSLQNGISGSDIDQVFYVYTDANKTNVQEYIRTSGGAVAVKDEHGNDVILPTGRLERRRGTVYDYGTMPQVASFEELRKLRPLNDGYRVVLSGYYENSTIGGGEFIGYLKADKNDDSGVIASGDGFYWVRVVDGVIIGPEHFGAKTVKEDSKFDSAPAFRSLVKYIDSKGGGNLYFEGEYNLLSNDTVSFTTPGDDGSLSVNFINAGVDVAIAPENTSTIPVRLAVPSGIRIVGKHKDSSILNFGWNYTSDAISLEAPIGIMFMPKSPGRMRAYVTGIGLSDCTVGGAFINVMVDGVLYSNCYFGEVVYRRSAFAAIMMGVDSCVWGTQEVWGCYAGFVLGGWWTQRNGTPLSAPWCYPYNSSDPFAVGWVDSLIISKFTFSGMGWSQRSLEIDNFFDNYFFKSRNNVRTADGGRVSNTKTDLKTANDYVTTNKFRGVTTRACSILDRYQRGSLEVKIANVKTINTSRVPFYGISATTGLYYGQIDNAYIERGNIISASGGWNDANNKFYQNNGGTVKDPWTSDITKFPALCSEGGWPCRNADPINTEMALPSVTPAVTKNRESSNLLVPSVDDLKNRTSVASSDALRYMSVWDGNKTYLVERLHFERLETQPITWLKDDMDQTHYFKTRTTSQANTTLALRDGPGGAVIPSNITGSIVYRGGIVMVYFNFTVTPDIIAKTNALAISGFPLQANHNFGSPQPFVNMVRAVLAAQTINVTGGGGGSISIPRNVLGARIDSGVLSLFTSQSTQAPNSSSLYYGHLLADQVFSGVVTYNCPWGLYIDKEGFTDGTGG